MLVLVSVLTGGKIHFHVRIGALILIGLSIFTKKDKIIYRVYIKYCVFSKILEYIPDSALSRFPLGVSVCTQWQVKPQRLQQNCKGSGKSQHFKEKHNF